MSQVRSDAALGVAAAAGRFAEADLLAIVQHRANGASIASLVVAHEGHSANSAPAPGPASVPALMSRSPTRRPGRSSDAHHLVQHSNYHHAATHAGCHQHSPDLPEELLAVLKRMRLPYLRDAAPEVLASARAQRSDPAEVLRILITEEIRGRDDATRGCAARPPNCPRGRRSSPRAR